MGELSQLVKSFLKIFSTFYKISDGECDLIMTFYERYEQCCQQKGIKPASQETADKLGCTKSNISHLAKTGQTPRGDLVAKFAVMLNISADYLLGLTETP